MKAPLYILPHGIEVIGEYPARGKNPYVRVRVRPHPLLSGKIVCGGIYTRRCRVVMTAHLGRKLRPDEHVHHRNGDRSDDRQKNLELLSAAEHNREHKIGFKHSEASRRKIGTGVRRAVSEGKMQGKRQLRGTEQPMAKLNDKIVRHIRTTDQSAYSLAKDLGVSKQVVLSARNRKTWSHVK